MNDNEKKYSIDLELLAVVWGLEKIRFYLYGKKVHLCRPSSFRTIDQKKPKQQTIQREITEMVRSPNAFDVSIQHIAGSNLKLTGCPSRNPVGEAMPKGNYNEEYVINILAEQADSNLKNGQLIGDQSNRKKGITERTKNNSEHIIEHNADQSQSNGMLENKNHVKTPNKTKWQHPGSPILPLWKTVNRQKLKIVIKWIAKPFTIGEVPEK